MTSKLMLANQGGATIAWVLGALVVGGAVVYYVTKPSTAAAATSTGTPAVNPQAPAQTQPPNAQSPAQTQQPAAPAANQSASQSAKLPSCGTDAQAATYAAEKGITLFTGGTCAGSCVKYVAASCSFFKWDGLQWIKDDATTAAFTAWMGQKKGTPNPLHYYGHHSLHSDPCAMFVL